MPSSWGDSWGSSWGNSWDLSDVPSPSQGGGGGVSVLDGPSPRAEVIVPTPLYLDEEEQIRRDNEAAAAVILVKRRRRWRSVRVTFRPNDKGEYLT